MVTYGKGGRNGGGFPGWGSSSGSSTGGSSSSSSARGSGSANSGSGSDLDLPGLGVHFKGWGTQFDEEIPASDVGRRIQVSESVCE